MEVNFKELEYKYNAEDVRLKSFTTLIDDLKEKHNYSNLQEASSWDLYYTKDGSEDDFQRFRNGTTPELTRKYKAKDSNNWEREEIDLPLDPKRVTEAAVSRYVSKDNYKERRRIFKSCFIHWFEFVNYVYYTVYNDDMKELGRFIEIEINKNRVLELGAEKSFELLKEHERNLYELGITPQHRLRKSLFEMFVKPYIIKKEQ